MSHLVYLKNELNGSGDFLEGWKMLEEKDKAELKKWAELEMILAKKGEEK